MQIRTLATGSALMIACLSAAYASAAAHKSGAADQALQLSADELIQRRLMIFQSGQTLFSERYRLPEPPNPARIEILDINPQFQPGSALTEGVGEIKLLALITRTTGLQQQLESQVGKTLRLKRYLADGSAIYRDANLLGIEGNHLLLEDNERIEYLPLDSGWQPMMPVTMHNHTEAPYLSIERSGKSADALTLSYMGGGLNWQADYALTLNERSGSLDLQAQATLGNHSGIDLSQSLVRLLAGQVNQPQSPRLYMAKAAMEIASDGAMPDRQAFEDYHIYTLPQPIDLPDGARVSVPLMPTQQLEYSNSYRFQLPVYGSAQPEPLDGRPQRVIGFTLPNAKQGGTPLPAGSARVYVQDPKQGLSYIGGQQLSAYAAGETVEMTLGELFDLGIEQTQTLYERQGNNTRLGYNITLTNASEKAKTVELSALFNQNWQIVQSSAPAEVQGASATWTIQVPAGGEQALSFRVELSRR